MRKSSSNRKSHLAIREQFKYLVWGFAFDSWRRMLNFNLKVERKLYFPESSLILMETFLFFAGRTFFLLLPCANCSSPGVFPGFPSELQIFSAGFALHSARWHGGNEPRRSEAEPVNLRRKQRACACACVRERELEKERERGKAPLSPGAECLAVGPSDIMGCGLRKLEEPEDSSPGKIYSTLKRAQVETRTDSVYEYVLLDFSLEGRSQ